MMDCDICHDTEGPFEITEIYKRDGNKEFTRCAMTCERCAKKIRKENKKNVAAYIRNKRYGC